MCIWRFRPKFKIPFKCSHLGGAHYIIGFKTLLFINLLQALIVLSSITKNGEIESASSPLVGFGELNGNIIKVLISLLSVEQEIEFIAYTCGLWNDKYIQGSTSRQT
jgi:hypothetical protein